MDERDRLELERAMHSAFLELPSETAPGTLLPRVMAAASRLRERPWYARSWQTWPQSWQVASLAVCLLVLAIASMPVPVTVDGLSHLLADAFGGRLTSMVTFAESAGRAVRLADTMAGTAASIWRTFCAPLFIYATTIAALLGAAVALCAAALDRLTPGKASY
jgi:hypothetical protein